MPAVSVALSALHRHFDKAIRCETNSLKLKLLLLVKLVLLLLLLARFGVLSEHNISRSENIPNENFWAVNNVALDETVTRFSFATR